MVAWLLLILAPVSVGAAGFLIRLYRRDQADGSPRVNLALVLALTGLAAALGGAFLGIVAAFYLAGQTDVVRTLSPGILVVILVLDAVPIVNAAYLRLLQRRES
jgi:hypothetical protein